jgi:hydroxymethylpyrimidine pyrophosphatase-like HAD family hydrolase
LEFTPIGELKGDGLLATLLDGRGRADEVVAAGDDEKDLARFDLATLSFAPENSPPAIRVRADRILDLRKEGLLAPIRGASRADSQ